MHMNKTRSVNISETHYTCTTYVNMSLYYVSVC